MFLLASRENTRTKEWMFLEKLARHLKQKPIIILLGVSHRSPPLLFYTISNQIDHFLE